LCAAAGPHVLPCGGGCRGEDPPPGVPATWIAPSLLVQMGQGCPAVKHECPAPRRSAGPAVQPFALDGLPAPRRPATVGGRKRDAPSARAASLASSAALPRPPGDPAHSAQLQGLDPYASPYASRYASPYARRWRTPGFGGRGYLGSSVPLRGASRPQKPRPTGPPRGSGASARQGALRAIDSFRRSRSWRTFGPRRLRRQSQPALVATQGDTAWLP
jgi:hypothetical protein